MAMLPTTISPKGRDLITKLGTLAYTDTTAKQLFALPKGAIIAGIYIIGATASNAGTTATVSVGSSATSNEYVSGFDVKTAATGVGYNPAAGKAVGSAMCTPITADTIVYGIYAESGTAGSAGAWTIKMEYYMPGPGEVL